MSTQAKDQKSGNEEAPKNSGVATGETTVSKQTANHPPSRENKTCKKVFIVSIAGLILPVALLNAWCKGKQFL
ncbi:MAG TPA: hypothetical protein VEP67_04070, partial [Thiobacillaceae bacterium]|nr:hypothetical protein [Thiobacillaceae bacterium]